MGLQPLALFPALLLALLARSGPIGPRSYDVDVSRSRLWVVTHRAGVLSFLGHEHAVVPGEWHAQLCLADPPSSGGQGALTIVARSLVIDSDSARELAGLGGGPSESQVRQIQRKLLDPSHLDAAGFPEIRLELLEVRAEEAGTVRARVRLELHGVARVYELPVKIDEAEHTLQLAGRLRIRQTDFGIKPESKAGVVNVADGVDLHFLLFAVPTPRACQLGTPTATASFSH